MRKPIITGLFTALSLSLLSGCSAMSKYHKDTYTERFEKLIQAMDEQDESTIKSLFAIDTSKNMGTPDYDISRLLEFYKGTSTDWEDLGASSDRHMGEGRYYTLFPVYKVTTDEETYRIAFNYTQYNEADKEKEGINSLLIMTEQLATEAQIWQHPPSKGISILQTLEDCNL